MNNDNIMTIRCIHCGKEFALDAKESPERRMSDDLVTCVHCGGILTAINLKDASLPPEFVKPPSANWFIVAMRWAGRWCANPPQAVARFFRRHVILQFSCYALVLLVSVAYLMDYTPTRLLKRFIPGKVGRMVYSEEEAFERSKIAVSSRLRSPAKAKFPWSFMVDVESKGEGNYFVKSYVDDVDEKNEWVRVYYVCLLSTDENGQMTVKSVQFNNNE